LLRDGAYDVGREDRSRRSENAEINRQVTRSATSATACAQMSNTYRKHQEIIRHEGEGYRVTDRHSGFFSFNVCRSLSGPEAKSSSTPNQEIDRIEAELSALAKRTESIWAERGEVERAYQAPTQALSVSGVCARKLRGREVRRRLVVMLHGALGDERYYFSGLFDPAVIKGEADAEATFWLA